MKYFIKAQVAFTLWANPSYLRQKGNSAKALLFICNPLAKANGNDKYKMFI